MIPNDDQLIWGVILYQNAAKLKRYDDLLWAATYVHNIALANGYYAR